MADLYNGYEPIVSVPPSPPSPPYPGVDVGEPISEYIPFEDFRVQTVVTSSHPDVFLSVNVYRVIERGINGEQWTLNGVQGVVQLLGNEMVQIPIGKLYPPVLPKVRFIRPQADVDVIFVTTFRKPDGTERPGSLITASRAKVLADDGGNFVLD